MEVGTVRTKSTSMYTLSGCAQKLGVRRHLDKMDIAVQFVRKLANLLLDKPTWLVHHVRSCVGFMMSEHRHG